MASTLIHMAIANEVNKTIKYDNDRLLIGSIAPDISKQIGESKVNSHFLNNSFDDIPNIDRFLLKYRDKMSDDFVLGYFIHLYTDYLWFKYFIPEIYEKDMIKKLDGTYVKSVGNILTTYIYNDYINLNSQLIDEYKMDLRVFYCEIPKFDNIIEEIPMDKIKIIIDKSLQIIQNSKLDKEFVFNIENIKVFISTSTELILAKIRELKLL